MRLLLLPILFLLAVSANTEVLQISTGHIPPYISLDDDQDILLDFLDEIAEDMGVEFEYTLNPWVRTEVNVQSHLSWGAVPYVKNDERLEIYHFSDSLFQTNVCFFYYDGDDRIKNLRYRKLSDLEGYSISGIRGYYYEKALKESGLDVSFLTNELQNMKFLAAGRVDLILINRLVGDYIIRTFFPEEDQNNFGVVPGQYHSSDVYLIMDKDYPGGELIMERFNRSLEHVKKKGTFNRLIQEHGLD